MTASTSSASIGIGPRFSFQCWGRGSAPAWVESPNGISVMGHTPRRGQASDQASRWARPVPANQGDKSQERHAEAAGSCLSHPCSPAPILTADQAGTATDTLTDLVTSAAERRAPLGAGLLACPMFGLPGLA